MKNLILILILALGLCPAAQATISFSETYADRLVSSTEDGEVFREVVSGGSFNVRGRVRLLPEDQGLVIDRETAISISIGNWSFEGLFGDDEKFVPGKSRSAKFKLPGGGFFRINFSAKAATWTVQAKTGTTKDGDSREDSAAAEGYYAEESYTIRKSDGETVEFNMSIADAAASASIPVSGNVKFVTRIVGSGDFAEEFGLCTVKIKGAGVIERE